MPVVLLHGWALGQHTYRDVVERIAAQGCRVIAPSLPGFGGSGELEGDEFSLSGYARWVDHLLASLEIDEPAVVMGHSFGGGATVEAAMTSVGVFQGELVRQPFQVVSVDANTRMLVGEGTLKLRMNINT